MRYAVDPRLVVDVLNRDPEWGERVARLLDAAYDACSLCRQDGPDVDGGYMSSGVLSSGAVALTCDGILTRHGGLYRRYFPSLKVIEP